MKQFFLLAAMVAACISCKKNDGEKPAPVFTKNLLNITLSNGLKNDFTYNASGRLIAVQGNYSSTSFQWQPALAVKHVYSGSGAVYETKNTVKNSAGKLISADKYYNGNLQAKLSFAYNAAGYLSSLKTVRQDIVSNFEISYYYEAGNLVKVTEANNGTIELTLLYEYDAALPNPCKVDWYEILQVGFIVDNSFGNLSKNLLKKEKQLDKNGVLIKEILFTWQLDADGYPVSMLTQTANNSTSYSFSFQ